MDNLFFLPDIDSGINKLSEEESRHCLKVLRKKVGDCITLTDGAGFFYNAQIKSTTSRQCEFLILDKSEVEKKNYSIHLAISPTKSQDRIEWMVEKCVELGVDKITFLQCKNSERNKVNMLRIEKVAISAMKQSFRAYLPMINPLKKFNEFVSSNEDNSSLFIAHLDQSNPTHLAHCAKPGNRYLVLIGPEGDFTPDELELASIHKFQQVILGSYRLRTETATLAACHTLNLINA